MFMLVKCEKFNQALCWGASLGTWISGVFYKLSLMCINCVCSCPVFL